LLPLLNIYIFEFIDAHFPVDTSIFYLKILIPIYTLLSSFPQQLFAASSGCFVYLWQLFRIIPPWRNRWVGFFNPSTIYKSTSGWLLSFFADIFFEVNKLDGPFFIEI